MATVRVVVLNVSQAVVKSQHIQHREFADCLSLELDGALDVT